MSQTPTDEELAAIFLADYVAEAKDVYDGGRLVHYTSAEAAFNILDSKEIWLRDTRLLNDFREVQHGLSCLIDAWQSEPGQRFRNWLNTMGAGLAERLEETFNAHSPSMLRATYMMSLSRHRPTEDIYGRLSMWRAYGGDAGVALVLNNTAFLSETEELAVFSAPVIYRDHGQFIEAFANWVDRVVAAEGMLRIVGLDDLANRLFYAFRVFVLCTKHPGFEEELEWRVFHTPPLDGTSSWLTPAWGVIRGTPQHYQRFALRDDDELNVTGVAIPTLIHKIIVGPCAHPEAIGEALIKKLMDAGMQIVPGTVTISDIPLRR